jgi:hypothetical protein
MSEQSYRKLTDEQIELLSANGCTAEDWSRVLVTPPFDARRAANCHFAGDIKLSDNTGTIADNHDCEKECGVYNARLTDCTIGDGVRIANIGVGIGAYDIGDNVCIENVGTMLTRPAAAFGNGVDVEVLNEGGGREVVLFNELSVQFAYMMCLHRYRPAMIEKMNAMAAAYVDSVKSDRGIVATGARICSTDEIIDVNIGESAAINCAASLINGTILSTSEAPTLVGAKVSAKDFIIAEGSKVTGAAVIDKVFVGQGCQVGKQYSAENSLFFANSEAFHGEACSVFAGPYTVTHHKSTLLIAGQFSFYNAGSGTNQSNHMYKLGPVHEGKLQRGTKTGSFSYMMWPCTTGPFCVVLGKHTGTFDVSDFPFSHLEARHDGKCMMVPGLHLTTVGTVRDGAKWPNRDRRKGKVKRDILNFDVFSPYTVGKMLKARTELKELQDSTDKSIEEVSVHGTLVRRLILRTSQKYYRTGIEMYLLGKLIEAVESNGLQFGKALAPADDSVYSDEWIDLGGQMMARDRLVALQDDIENGKIETAADLTARLNKINDAYAQDEWAWICKACQQVFDIDPARATADEIGKAADMYLRVRSKFFNLVIADAQKEFGAMSQSGFGQDGAAKDIEEDFRQVRGTYDDNKFVKEMKASVETLNKRIAQLKEKLAAL